MTGRGSLFGLETTVLAGYTYIDPRFKSFPTWQDFKHPTDSLRLTEAYRNALYSSVSADSATYKNVLKYRYRHTAKFDVESRTGKFSFGMAGIYNSFMENIDEVFEALVVPGLRQYRRENKHGDLILSVRTSFFPNEHLKMSLLCNNLTNREYVARPGKVESTRNVTLRVDYDF